MLAMVLVLILVVVVVVALATSALVVVAVVMADAFISQVSTRYQLLFQAPYVATQLCRVVLEPEEVSFRIDAVVLLVGGGLLG